MNIEHKGFEQFIKGEFGNGGDNLFVDAFGVIRRIGDNDLNGDGIFDLVLPNSHGYVERAPTYIYTLKDNAWVKKQLPHDSCWAPKTHDVDGDGFVDLIIVNGENGVTSELKSYIYWGGPNGLTGEVTAFDTVGAYDCAVCDINGDGLNDVIFSSAWYDHHNPGILRNQMVFLQTSPRKFIDATAEYGLAGMATTSLVCDDLNGDGYPELVLANHREQFNYDTDSFIYWGSPSGFDTENPTCLPTHYAMQVLAYDLDGDGFKELIFTGGNRIIIYWNDKGSFSAGNRLELEIQGIRSQFSNGILNTDIADIDADGVPELVIGTADGIEIRKADQLNVPWKKISCFACSWVKAVDIRNSGLMDIVASNYCTIKTYDTESMVFWNHGNEFSTDQVKAFQTHGPMGCTAADLDNDGIKEVIFCNTMAGPAQYDPEFPIFAYYGNQDCKYLPENRREYPVNISCHTYVAADVDNDGYVELIATCSDGLRIFKGTPNGPDPADYYDLIHTPGLMVGVGGVLAGDFNHDGWLDLIMVPWIYSEKDLENSVYVYFGGPLGYSDDRRMVLPSFTRCSQAILLADINNDGFTDFLYGDGRGFIGVYYGGPDGFSAGRFGRIDLRDYNGALIMGLAAADIDNDGWLELFVTTAGHYTRQSSHLYVLYGGIDNYPKNRMTIFDTGGTTGFPALADMYCRGRLDLLLPFYSTAETRVLPARIFRGDGRGDFDWDNPMEIECPASIAFCPVDLSGNGYPDLFICCHRNDIGHIVNSKLIMNGPDGMDIEHQQDILGYGPHNFTAKNQGNTCDRSCCEYYTSPVFKCINPVRLSWQCDMPYKTSLSFRVRYGASRMELMKSSWTEDIAKSGSVMRAPAGSSYMQYRVSFDAPGLVNSPRLFSVTIECDT